MGLPRSYLFVPGDRPERFDKAAAVGAGQVIVDLEDAVSPEAKGAARDAIARWLATPRPVAVRINGADTPWFEDDLALCRDLRVAAVMPAKATTDSLRRLAEGLPGCALLPLVETAEAMASVQAIAASCGVQRLVFGSIDFQLALGMDGDWEELLPFRAQLVLASALAGCGAPVDGVSTVLDDPAQVKAEAQRARRLGFGAKLCIHPRQVQPVQEAFAPTPEQLAWARRVVAAAEASGNGAVAVDGRMIDRPVVLQAQALLDAAG